MSQSEWFIERFTSEGSAIGFRIEEKVHEEQSPYQKIEIYKTTDFGYLMVIDGCVMLTGRDNFIYHEMMSHPAIHVHPNPENVVIIGGGDCGTLREILKHPQVKTATQIDIDELVTRLSEKYFPELCESNSDPRAELLFEDGVKWIAEAERESVDVIIIDSTDPVGPAEGLFTKEFFEMCQQVLKPGGIFVQQSESPLFHADSLIGKMRKELAECGFDTIKTFTFPQCCYPSGWWSCTMAGKVNLLNLQRDIDACGLGTKYYNRAIHEASLAIPQFCCDIWEEK